MRYVPRTCVLQFTVDVGCTGTNLGRYQVDVMPHISEVAASREQLAASESHFTIHKGRAQYKYADTPVLISDVTGGRDAPHLSHGRLAGEARRVAGAGIAIYSPYRTCQVQIRGHAGTNFGRDQVDVMHEAEGER